MKQSGLWVLVVVFCVIVVAASPAAAAPVEAQVTPIAVYHDAFRPFGMAYDPRNDLIWYTQGDNGDAIVHSARPFNSFTPAELAGFTTSGGVFQLSTTDWEKDVAGTTNGPGSAHFRSLAYDSAINQIVQQDPTATKLISYDAFTGGNANLNYAAVNNSFSDGLDVDGGTLWYSEDVQEIQKNGALFIDPTSSAQTDLPTWLGLGSADALGYSGVEQIGDRIWAVSVQSGGDAGRTRTIVSFDTTTGVMETYDDDGDPIAARWEDLAFDGRYLYAADLRGNADSDVVVGDIYVFDIIGPGGSELVPEPASVALLAAAAAYLGIRRRRRKS